jgi:hypothetical protein
MTNKMSKNPIVMGCVTTSFVAPVKTGFGFQMKRSKVNKWQ